VIDNIKIKNFKSLKDTNLNTRSLNLLSGLNGMGKSSLIQSLLLIKQSENLFHSGQLKLNGWLFNVGKGKDALYQFAEEDIITFAFSFNSDKKVEWSFQYKPDWEILESGSKNDPQLLSEFISRLQYLSADRLGPQPLYDVSQASIDKKDFGTKGEYAIHYLQAYGRRFKVDGRMKHNATSDISLLSQLNAWLNEISPGVKVNISEVPGVDKMILSYEFELGIGKTASFRPNNVGFGISFSLSVILSLLTADEKSIIIIENPEAHIHPRGQAELGKLMALCASCGAQLFIETHSDHIINGIRVAVKEKMVDKKNVNIFWFSKMTTDTEQYTKISEIHIDENGELSDYPKDFLDEWNNQLVKLV
jgi:predicted ATPase